MRWAGRKATKPVAAEGLKVKRFASGLTHPRWLYVLPNGDVLVAETERAAAARADGPHGLGHEDGDGMGWRGGAEPQPHHAAARRRRRWRGGDEIDLPQRAQLALRHGADRQRFLRRQHRRGAALPLSRGRHHHHRARDQSRRSAGWRLTTITGPRTSSRAATARRCSRRSDRTAMPARMAWTPSKAAPRSSRSIPRPGQSRPFATGLRNPVGLAFEPKSGALWVAVNERDELGSDLVPDYMTAVKDGGFYGWPYSYYGDHLDPRVKPQQPRSRRQGDRARLCARPAHRLARARLLRRHALAGALSRRRLRRPARLVEPRSAQRLQGHLRAVCRR